MSHGGGGPMRAFSQEKHKNIRSNKVLLRELWGYLKKFKLSLVISGILILLYTLGNMFSPLIITAGLDSVVTESLFIDTDFLTLIFIIFLGISLVVWILNASNTYILARVRANMLHDVRSDVFDKLVNADMNFHTAEQSGNVTSRVTSDADELAAGITVATSASSQLLLGLGTFVILLVISPIMLGVALLAIPVAWFLAKVLGSLGRKTMYSVRRSYGEVSGQMAESLAGVGIAKSFNREEWSSSVLSELNEKTYQFFKQLGALFNFLFPAISMISTILVALTLVVGGWLSTAAFSLGSIYLGTIMVQRFLGPILHLAMFYPQLIASLAAMDRITDVLEQQPVVINSPTAQPLNLDDTSVSFEGLTYEYEKGTPVLENVTFKVNQGEKIAVVGHTGAGKTTLAALIARFYDPTEGRILIGKQDLRDITLESLHSAVGLIPQEPYLFADTVVQNIKYGNEEITAGEIFELCKLIGAEDFIQALPNGYETQLKESGKGLSSGQRQMITIARTMLADPKILVLDEATSRLDAYSESLVQLAQKALFEGRTTFVIAHRLTTIRDVDRIAVFEKGKLVELGTHEELLEKKGVYFELYMTYYQHQGVEELTEVYMAPQETSTFGTQAMPQGMASGGHGGGGMGGGGMGGGGMGGGGMGGGHGSGMDPKKMHEMMQKSGMTTEKMREMMQEGSMKPEDMHAMIKEQGMTPEEKRKKLKGKGSK